MYKFILLITVLSLTACSATDSEGMIFSNKNPRGISVLNVVKEERVKAYREAEKHCAKYSKVPRVLKSDAQAVKDEYQAAMMTIIFECLKPSN